MLNKLLAITFVLGLLNISQSFAQYACGFKPSKEQIAQIDQLMAGRTDLKTTNGALVSIPLKFHLIRRSDGTGGITQSQVDATLTQLNEFYECTNMSFRQEGDLNYIDNDDYYDLNASNEEVIATGNDVSKVINLYFSNSLRSGQSPLCGYTRFPPSTDRVFLVYSCVVGGGTTLEHELGHYFTLYHTHGTTNTGTTDELVDGSNCETAGDRICDTPADPNLSGQTTNCIYTGTAVDANGDLYQPDPRNVMSYAPDNCGPYISPGQCARAREGFERGRSYLNFTFEEFGVNFTASLRNVCVENTVDFTGISFGAISWAWEFEGGTPATSTAQNPTVRYDNGGNFAVRLTVTSASGQEVSINKSEYIEVSDPVANAIAQNLSYPLDNNQIPSELEIENKDLSYTFEYSDVDRNNSSSSGSILMNNFAYESESIGSLDKLYFPYLDLDGVSRINVTFDYAYAPLKGTLVGNNITVDTYDSLSLLAETECGTDKVIEVWAPGRDLATVAPQLTAFVPTTSSEWEVATASLERQSEDEEFAYLYLLSTSNNANNLYIDNIEVELDYSVDAPVNLRRSASDPADVSLRWTSTSINELGFIIERKQGEADFEEIARAEKNAVSYLDEDVETGFSYTYRVKAYSKNDTESESSNELVIDDFDVTGLEDNPIIGLKLYPNPATDRVELRINNSELGELSLEVYTITGQLVERKSYTKSSTVLNTTLSTQSYGSGMYVIKFALNDRVSTQKLNIIK